MTLRFLMAAALLLPMVQPATAQDMTRGRRLFAEKGCYACHGYQGQGAVTGPKLAPDPIPLAAMQAFIRHSGSTQMPPYSARVLSDAELADIHAWLAGRPPTKNPKDMPLLAH